MQAVKMKDHLTIVYQMQRHMSSNEMMIIMSKEPEMKEVIVAYFTFPLWSSQGMAQERPH
jgi:hypothetical protein